MTPQDLLPSVFVPVLIGYDRKACRLGRRLFWQHGMLSHVFAEQFPPLCRLTPWMICHTLPRGASPALYEIALTDFAAEREAAGITSDKVSPILLPRYTHGNPRFEAK